MKIVRIIARLNVGGPARHVVWLTKELQDNEFQSLLIAGTVPAGEEDMAYLALENGVEPFFIESMSRELSPKDISSLYKVFRQLQREKPDVVHTHTAKAGTVGRVAGLLYRWLTFGTLIGHPRKVSIVHTFHGHVFHSYYGNLKTRVFIIIEKILARIATDKIVVISEQQFREIHRENGIGSEEQFKVIPLGIDLAHFSDPGSNRSTVRKELRAADDELLIGFVGRLTDIKNVSLLLNAAALYAGNEETDSPKLRFIIVGDGHLRPNLEAEAGALGIRDLVTFLGNRTDTESIYSGLDIVALTSLNEGTPLSLIEAMACGRPVISTAVGGVVDLLGKIETSHNGFAVCERGIIVQSKSPENFLEGLIFLAQNENLGERLGIKGKAFVEANYSKQRLVADIKALYRGFIP